MKSSAKSYMSAGVAIVGAGVIAAGPIAPLPDNAPFASRTQEFTMLAHVAAADPNTEFHNLLAGFDPAAALRAFIEGTLLAYSRPGPVPYTPVTGPLDGASRIGEGVLASGLRFGANFVITPVRFVELIGAIAQGQGAPALSALVENLVDGPLWTVDPVLYALRDALPAPLGGPDGYIENFRNELWKATQEINAALHDPTGAVRDFVEATLLAYSRPGPVPFTPVTGPFDGLARVSEGLIASGMRLVAAAIMTPLGFVQLAGAIAQGNGAQGLSVLIENLVDGPLWVADPLLYGLRDALPAPLGGPGDLVEDFRNGIWAASEQINSAIRAILGLPEPNAGQQIQMNALDGEITGASVAAPPNLQARVVNLPQEKAALPLDSEAEDQVPPQPDPKEESVLQAEEPGPVDEPAADPVSKNDENEPTTRSAVRKSPNFTRDHKSSRTDAGSGAGKAGKADRPERAKSSADSGDND